MKRTQTLFFLLISCLAINLKANDCGTLQDIGFPPTLCVTDENIYPLDNDHINYSQFNAVYQTEIEGVLTWVFQPSLITLTSQDEFNGYRSIWIGWKDLCDNQSTDPQLEIGCIEEVQGCTDMEANNFNMDAVVENGTCTYDANEEVTKDTLITIIGDISEESFEGNIKDWSLEGTTLNVVWEIVVSNQSFDILIPYTITTTEGLVVVEIVVEYLNALPKGVEAKTATNNSISFKKGIRISKVTGNNSINTELKLFPVPLNNELFLREVADQVSIFDQNGIELINEPNTSKIDVSELNEGSYFIKVIVNGTEYNQAIIK